LSPAAHAAVGAALAHRTRSLPLGLAAAFASHFLLDAIWHFEAFYAVAVSLGVSVEAAVLITALPVGLVIGPAMLWLSRADREVLLFCGYAAAANLTAFAGSWERQLALAAALSAIFLALTRSRRAWVWIAGALAANIPDQWKLWSEGMRSFHDWWHYGWESDLGFWLHRLAGETPPSFWGRLEDPLSILGYVLQIAIEAALLLGGLWLLARPRRQARKQEERQPSIAPLAERV